MNNIIFAIISIVLTSALATLSISYIPSDAYTKHQIFKELNQGYGALEQSVVHYLRDHRDANGTIIYPGNGADMRNAISPSYGYIPADVKKELTWEVKAGAIYGLMAVGICAKPVGNGLSNAALKSLELVQAQMPPQAAIRASTCNAATNEEGGDHLTYWVVLSHLE